MYFVYILHSKKDRKFYTGLTKNLQRRLSEHNLGTVKSTKSRRPFELVYSEKVESLAQARKREKFLKSGNGREYRNRLLKK